MRAELAGALMLLTRLPTGCLAGSRARASLADTVWAFPVVGAAVGALGGASYWVCFRLGLPPALGVIGALAAMLLATGALHEDGLADTADAFGGDRTHERRLEIMRDSRIGSFGALALLLALATRGAALASLGSPGHVTAALVAAGALGRGAILMLLFTLTPARPDGLAASLRARRPGRLAAGLVLTVACAFALLRPAGAVAAIASALLVSLSLSGASRRQIGGYTGDVLGAASVATECVVLALLTAPWSGFRGSP